MSAAGPMPPARRKGRVLVAGLAVSGLTLVCWTQPWFEVALDTETAAGSISVGGEVAAGGLAALALAGLALVGALAIAGPVFRVVLAGLEILLGLTVLVASAVALADPVRASAPSITEATGIAGIRSITELVGAVTLTAWPWLAILCGALTVAVGVAIALTSGRWPGSGRRFSATRLVADDDRRAASDRAPVAAREVDPIADWDALSDGSDPTGR